MPLTPEEQKEMEMLEQELSPADSQGLTPEEEKEMAALEAELEPTGSGESFLRGASEGATLGFHDEIVGGVEGTADYVRNLFKDVPEKKWSEFYKEARDESRAAQKKAEKQNPASFTGGQVAGGIGSMLVPGGAIAKGAMGAGKLAKGAIGAGKLATGGAVAGAGSSEAEDIKGIASDAKSGAATALVTGGLLKGAGATARGIGKGLHKAGNAKELAELGVSKSAKKALGKEGREEAAKLARKEKILTSDVDETVSRATSALRRVGDDMDVFWNKHLGDKPQFNPRHLSTDIEKNIIPKIRHKHSGANEETILPTIIQDLKRIKPGDKEGLKEFKKQVGEMTQHSNKDVASIYSKVYSKLNDHIEANIKAASGSVKSPKAIDELKQLNKRYRLVKTLTDSTIDKAAGYKPGSAVGLQDTLAGSIGYSVAGPLGAAVGYGLSKVGKKYGPSTASRVHGVLERGGPRADKIKKLLEAGQLSDVAAMVAAQKNTEEK